ncbi:MULTISPECIES: hypothetical protein [Flavobacterium]|uniref:Lipoprotein n=1 Tax=Flavobacterium jumunjinense TaxID=998845 RepID=A0ABV5GS91_9FLAO|nr:MULTISPECIES: hypothetical protein [Flavobacterium]
MKNYLYLLFGLFLISCEKEKTSDLAKIESQLKTDNLYTSEFILKNDTLLKGKLGTEIAIPFDLFDNYTNGKIKFELKEYFTKEDMILNGLSTITDKDELLESSGMIYINFTEEGKQLNIKKGRKYTAKFPNTILEKSNIYTNDNDSIFKWKLEDEKIKISIPDFIKELEYLKKNNVDSFKSFLKEVSIDSLNIIKEKDSITFYEILKQQDTKLFNNNKSFYLNLGYQIKNGRLIQNGEDTIIENLYNNENEIYSLTSGSLNWINIDRIKEFEFEKKINFNINIKCSQFSVNIIYLESNSCIKQYINYNSNSLNIKILGKMKVVIYTNNDQKIYYDSFYLDKNSKINFDIKLKETTLDQLKTMLVSQ